MGANPKILFVTTPIRPNPGEYPPMGSLSVMTSLKRAGFKNTWFYNIDLLRPTYKDVINHIEKVKPDILAISAVVSTAYEYTKKLSRDVKKILPGTSILLGGNLGASAEIILKKTGVDFVCTGEGERTAVDFAKCWLIAESKSDFREVNGLAFLDNNGEFVVTPYAASLNAEEINDIDWSILEDLNQMDFFARPKESSTLFEGGFTCDPRSLEAHRNEKTVVILNSSKGCVAKCTFCHRWDTGIRYVPVPVLMERIDFFIDKFNMGFINFGDENFGSDKKWLDVFLREIKKRDLIWTVGGMRVSTASLEMVKQMKEAGCSAIYFGMESGSQKMLDVMGKVTTVEQNKNVIEWLPENGLDTCLQLILGMPGETLETIRETKDFVCFYAENSPKTDPNRLAINFAQALPGTPLYELARRKGFIGESIDDEEKYLSLISDRDARDGETYINYTDYPKLLLEKWHFDIQLEARIAYINKWGIDNYINTVGRSRLAMRRLALSSRDAESGYFAYPARAKEELQQLDREVKKMQTPDEIPSVGERPADMNWEMPPIFLLFRKNLINFIPMYYPRVFWRIRFFSLFFVLVNSIRKYGVIHAGKMLVEYISWKISSIISFPEDKPLAEYVSLRKVINRNIIPKIPSDNPAMANLRKGR